MGRFDVAEHLRNDFWMLFGEVLFLEGVTFEIIDLEGGHFTALLGLAIGLPISFADGLGKNGLAIAFAEFEVEEVVFLLLLFLEKRKEGDSVDLVGNRLFSEVGHGGEDVPKCAQMIGGATGVNDGRPADQHWSADASLVHVTLHAPERSSRVPEVRIVSTFAVCSIVRSKNHESIVGDLVVVEEGEDITDLIIQVLDHGSESGDGVDDIGNGLGAIAAMNLILSCNLIELGKFFAPFGMEFLGGMHRGVRNRRRDVAKEGCLALGIRLDELHGVVHDDVVNVCPFFEGFLFPVVDVGGGVVGVGNHLAFPANELVKAVIERVGVSFHVGEAEAPFAIGAGVVSGCFKDFGKNGELRVKRSHFVFGDIATKVNGPRLVSGHEDGARGTANGVAGIVGGELQSLGANAVDVGGLELFLPVNREISQPKVVGENVDDVWLLLGLKKDWGEREQEKKLLHGGELFQSRVLRPVIPKPAGSDCR